MEMPRPTKFHKKLEVFVGDWSGDETMFPVPWDPAGGSAKGRYKVRAAFDGFGVIQDYVQKRGGKTSYAGHGVMGYDPQANGYIWHWSDTMGGVANAVTSGQWKGNKLTFQHAGPMGHARYTYTIHKDGTVGFSIDNSTDGDQWVPFMSGRYAKKA